MFQPPCGYYTCLIQVSGRTKRIKNQILKEQTIAMVSQVMCWRAGDVRQCYIIYKDLICIKDSTIKILKYKFVK